MLVTGGYDGNDYLDSTELMVPGSGSWRLAAGLLPRMESMRVATMDNNLYLTGDSNHLTLLTGHIITILQSHL